MDKIAKDQLKAKFSKKPEDESINIDMLELLADIKSELVKLNSIKQI